MSNENRPNSKDTEMCPHGNFPASCKQCDSSKESTTTAVEEKTQDKLSVLATKVGKKMDTIDAKLSAGKAVTPQEVYDMMLQMDADLSDEYGKVQNEWRNQHPEMNDKPMPEDARRPEYFQLYNRREQILDKLSRETLTPLKTLLRGEELPEVESTKTEKEKSKENKN